MSGKLMERYADKVADSDGLDVGFDAEDLGVFAFLRGMNARSVMIELRKKSGEILAIGYGYIDRIQFDPSDGITLCCGSRNIIIKGKNLNKEIRPQVTLFQGLTRNRVPWVAEADQAAVLQAGANAVLVESIEW